MSKATQGQRARTSKFFVIVLPHSLCSGWKLIMTIILSQLARYFSVRAGLIIWQKAIQYLIAGILLASIGPAWAEVRYVDVNSTNATPPYTNWAIAAANIQDAVDAAAVGDEIVVANGLYATGWRTLDGVTTNRVAVDKPLTLRSLNGPQFTSIDGSGLVRCASLTNGASLSGFTLTNGIAEAGGGANGGTLNNCRLTGNRALGNADLSLDGRGGGAYGCTLYDCTLISNSATGWRWTGSCSDHWQWRRGLWMHLEQLCLDR